MRFGRSTRRALLAAAGPAAVSLSGCVVSQESSRDSETGNETEWPLAGGDSLGRNYVPDAAAPREDVTDRWTAEAPLSKGKLGRPVVASGTLFLPTGSELVAFDVATGDERWRTGVKAEHLGVGDYLYASSSSDLVALDPDDGSERWRVETRGDVSVPPVFGSPASPGNRDWLFVGDRTGRIYQIDPDDGTIQHTRDVFGGVSALSCSFSDVVFGTWAGEVYSLSASDDGFADVGRRQVIGSVTSIALLNYSGSIIVGTRQGHVYNMAYSRFSRWALDSGASYIAVRSSYGIAVDGGGLVAIDLQSGEPRWRADAWAFAPIALTEDTVYIPTATGVAAYKTGGGIGVGSVRFGARRWHYEIGLQPRVGLVVADGAVIAVTYGEEDSSRSQVHVLEPA